MKSIFNFLLLFYASAGLFQFAESVQFYRYGRKINVFQLCALRPELCELDLQSGGRLFAQPISVFIPATDGNRRESDASKFRRSLRSPAEKEIPISPGQSALTAYLTGRILNLNPEFDQNAIDSLNKSLRLDVNNANAWIELGKAAWKKPDLEQALTAFKANTYLLRFFATAQLDGRDLDHSIDAYEKALNQKILFINADLHINYQEALLYKQNYRLALFHAERAVQIEPHFDSAIERLDSLRTFLLRLSEGISRKGMLPSRKIKDIVASINNADSSNELKTINELKIGVNPEVAICTKILSVISHNQKVPFTIIGIDQNSNCFGVTVFNFSNTFNLLANDQLLIPTPHVVSVEDVEINETKLNFKLIRVDDPSTLIRNKKRLSSTSRSLTDVSFQFKNK
ncbi:Tetratricopeptide repeat domain 5 [Aphelenchoides besseyi]|nr:Tetratricopeptide repeat domain 5 [Aphelenchoides besseyi]